MNSPQRLASGGLIDRAKAIRFSFDGKSLQGVAGDSLASALVANGVRLVGRSFKYHRPRGILSAGPEEPNALVTIDRGAGCVTPNLRATHTAEIPYVFNNLKAVRVYPDTSSPELSAASEATGSWPTSCHPTG